MKKVAAHVADAFRTDGVTWRERPVTPPPFVPSAKQIQAAYLELLARVVDAQPDDVTGRVYDFAMARGLRVMRLTKREEPEQRFMLQAERRSGGRPAFVNVQIVDANGDPAEWVPPEKPQAVSKADLKTALDERDSQIAELQAQVAALSKGDV